MSLFYFYFRAVPKCAGRRRLLLDFHPDGAAGTCMKNATLAASSSWALARQRSKTSAYVHALHSCAGRERPLEAISNLLHICSQIQAMEVCWALRPSVLDLSQNDWSCFCQILMLSNWAQLPLWQPLSARNGLGLLFQHDELSPNWDCPNAQYSARKAWLYSHFHIPSAYLDPHGLRSISPDVSVMPWEVFIYLGPFLYVWWVPMVRCIVLSTQIQQNGSAAQTVTRDKKGAGSYNAECFHLSSLSCPFWTCFFH